MENTTTSYYVAPGMDEGIDDFINNYSPKKYKSDPEYSKYIENLDDETSGGAKE